MEFEFKYRFESNNINEFDEIYEIKYLNFSNNSPKNEKYQWYYQTPNDLIKLTFLKMDNNIREFKEGILILTENGCIYNGKKFNKIE
ncbi:hypothetical protein crov050 [Cafeteria roenbergensis virus]|uniref:Uncharacterized protein n=1 Tax=Cafeteria roenbergensis virus (strain BV-PW1) TaxID=693272 RepID=E3T4G8_CROVB|nr:hypothetical protein crov050 [Cafeteria roenbergensis virus BV-PW1]ADO67083.1 hypothetical protein crov050 [Cafeteria roenbergensis virus BV-PW1]